jgi:hypothetical protein
MTAFWKIGNPVRVLLLAGLLCAAGCDGDNSVSNESPDPAPEAESKPDPASAVSLEVLNGAETGELIASHKGRIVVVDLWALW